MSTPLTPPLTPRRGTTLRVVIVCRISTEHQDERSLDDQEALLRQFVERHYDGPVHFHVIRSQGSGENLDRRELFEFEELIESGEFDLALGEDLARFCRRKRAYDLCELCEDHGARLIAVNDQVDTGKVGWQDSAFISTWHHERSNRDTSDRIRRSLRNRHQNGGALRTPIAGYIKPPGAKTDDQMSRDPAYEPIYDHWFQLLEDGASFSDVADWLNAQGVPVGPNCRNPKWDCRMVGRVTRNPLLKGVRVRNDRMSKRVNKTGRRKSVKAPAEERLERECPHLAFIEPQRFDRVIRMLKQRNDQYSRKDRNGDDTRRDVPKKRTRFPGQIIECGICGYGYVFGGHGQTDHLMCDGARRYCCWNGVSVDGPLAAAKITSAVLSEIESIPDFDQVFLEMVNEEANRLDADAAARRLDCEQQVRKLERELDNLMELVKTGLSSDRLRVEIVQTEEKLAECQLRMEEIQNRPRCTVDLPSIDVIKSIAREAIHGSTVESWEFNRLMQRLIPKIVVFPYRLCDGGPVVLKARFRLHLANLLDDVRTRNTLLQPLERVISVDLFVPPQREAFRQQIVSMRRVNVDGSKKTERMIAAELGITITAAQRAAALQRQMDGLDLSDPYLPVTQPPDDFGRMRRHKHPRYAFEPLPHAGEF